MSVTGSIMAGVGLAGSIGGAAISSNAAGNAADQQAAAANHAADLQYKASQEALAFQKQQYNQGQSNLAPWLQSGAGALSNLDYLLGITPPTTQGQMAGGPVTPYGGNQQQQQGTPGFGSNTPIGMRPTTGMTARGGPIMGPGDTSGAGGMGHIAGGPVQAPGANFSSLDQPMGGSNVARGSMGMGHMIGGPISSPTGPQAPSGSLPGYANPGTTGPAQFGSTQGGVGAPGTTGTTNLGSMVNPNLGGFGSLMQANPYSTFTAPTGLTMQNDPGYQARMQLGTDAIQRSAAARGNLLTGGTAQALEQYGQDYGSNEYSKAYDRAFNTNAYNYNGFNQNQNNQFNRLAAISGIGQQTAGQLGYLGNDASQGISSNLLNTAANMGQQYNNAAAANASGIVGGANAWSGALGGTSNNLQQLLMMQQLMGGGGGAGMGAGIAGMGV